MEAMPSLQADAERVAMTRGAGGENLADSGVRLFFGRGRRLPMIRQSEAAECGLACLAMIAGYYGHHVALPELRRRFSLSLKGVTATRLIEIAQSLGMQCRPLRLDLDEIAQLQTPCILHWGLDHFIVLQSLGKRHVQIHDPAAGERKVTLSEFSRQFTGVALEIFKGPTFQRKQQEPPVSLRALAGSVHGLGRALTQIFGLALVLELFSLLSPLFLQMVVDQVLADGDADLLTFLGLSFALLMLLQTVVSALRTWTTMWLGTHFNLAWTGNVFQHLLRLPQPYFLKRHLGDIVSRFGAVQVIQQTLTTKFVEVILDGLMAVLTLGMMLIYSPLLAGLTVLAISIYAGLRVLYYRVYYAANFNQITVAARQQTQFIEAVRGVQTLRLYNQTSAQTARYLNAAADTLNTSIAVQRLNLVFGSMSGLVSGAQRIGVLWMGAWLAMRGQFSAGMLMAYVAYANQFSVRTSNLVDYVISMKLLRAQTERLSDIVLTAPETHAESVYVGPQPSAKISFYNVSFRYSEGEPWILKDCSFQIDEGESVVIVGPSGSGKSTLIRLMLGLLDPQFGKIEVGGVDVRQLGKIAFRAMIGCVMQDDHLFSGSIADNISFFDSTASSEAIETAAKQARIHDDIAAMPMGYHSLVGDMGSTLSGGQIQRLLLARALYKCPKLLILDEATSNLDTVTERLVLDALRAMPVTRISVAHRLSTIEMSDRVLLSLQGKVTDAPRTRECA